MQVFNIVKSYWSDLKRKLIAEGSQLSEKIGQFKMVAADGKMRPTDCMTTEHPSDFYPKAMPNLSNCFLRIQFPAFLAGSQQNTVQENV